MAKKTRRGFQNPNATSSELPPRPAKVSDMLTGIAQLMLQGHFPGTHSKLVVAAINSLEFLANIERSKEGDPANKVEEEPKTMADEEVEELDEVAEALAEGGEVDENRV